MSETQKRTLTMAVVSLILGIIGLIPLIGILFGLIALILGVVALVKISRNQETLKGKGMAIAGIVMGSLSVVLLPILAILAAIIIPNLFRAKEQASMAYATSALKTISAAAESYRVDKGSYPASLKDLADGSAPYIPESMAADSYNGYGFWLVKENENSYCAIATPNARASLVKRSLCVTQDGVVRIDFSESKINDCDACRALAENSSGSD